MARKAANSRAPQIEKVCPYCGLNFSTAWANRITCGAAECKRQHASERVKRGGWLHRTNAIKRGAPADTAELFDPFEIFERDGWICGICAAPVDPALSYPHRESASLDHIEPVQAGGAHTRDNVQCSHLYCNRLHGRADARARAESQPQEAEQAA